MTTQKNVTESIEHRFYAMANSAPVMMWLSDLQKLCYYFNKSWLDFRGRTLEQEYGNGWAEGVHPDDLDRCWEVYSNKFDAREKFQMEYRLKRYDGEYRWILDSGAPIFNADGVFEGYIGSCTDISYHKEAEELLQSAYAQLGKRIKERTDDLAKKVGELERLNEIMMGREEKIIELKNEIKNLRQELVKRSA